MADNGRVGGGDPRARFQGPGLASLKDSEGRSLTVWQTCPQCGVTFIAWRTWAMNRLAAGCDRLRCGDCRARK